MGKQSSQQDQQDIRALVYVQTSRYSETTLEVFARFVRIELEDGTEHVRNLDGTVTWARSAREVGMADLQIHAIGEIADGSGMPDLYGWRTEYREPFTVDQPRAEIMVKTLRAVTRGLDKDQQTHGTPESFPAYMVRAARALGVTQFGFLVGQGSGWYDGNEYRWIGAAELAGYVNVRVQSIRTAAVHS